MSALYPWKENVTSALKKTRNSRKALALAMDKLLLNILYIIKPYKGPIPVDTGLDLYTCFRWTPD